MVANAVRRIALGRAHRLRALLRRSRRADRRRAPGAAGAGAAAEPALAHRRAAPRMPPRGRGSRRARGAALHRRLREHRAVGRQHAAVALRGGRRRHPRVDRSGALVAAGLPPPRGAARARRRAGGGGDRCPRAGLRAAAPAGRGGGPAWELALRAIDAHPRRRRRSSCCGGAAATGARAPRAPIAQAELARSPAAARRSTRASWPATRSRSSAPPWARWIACASSRRGCVAT